MESAVPSQPVSPAAKTSARPTSAVARLDLRAPMAPGSVGGVGANTRREHAGRVSPEERVRVLAREVLAADLRERVDSHHLRLELQASAREAAVVAVQLVQRAARIAVREREPRAIQRAELFAEH